MLLNRIIGIAILLCLLQLDSIGQHWQWAKPIISTSPTNNVRSLAVDEQGNSYVTGSTSGTVMVDDFTLNSANTDAGFFIAKFDPTGRVLWADLLGGENAFNGQGVAVDKEGNSYFTGFLKRTTVIGDITVSVSGSQNLIVVKCDSNGKVLWVNAVEAKCCYPSGLVKTDALGNVYVVGQFRGEIVVGDVKLSSNNNEIFMAKYDSNGILLRVEKYGSTGDISLKSVAMDAEGNAFITGSFTGTISYNGVQFSSTPGIKNSYFLKKINADGAVVWAKHAYSNDWDAGIDVTVDAAGNCFLAGGFSKTIEFDHIQISSTIGEMGIPSTDTFLAKYDSNGNVVWVRRLGGPGGEETHAVAVDDLNNSYITGKFWDKANFDDWQLCGGQHMDLFVVKVDEHGNIVWAVSAGGSDYEDPRDIALDSEGNCLLTGLYNEISTFGAISFGSENDEVTKFFVAKLDVSSYEPSSIATKKLSTTAFCPGAAIAVAFDVTGNFTSCNTYTIQLSDAEGSFTAPITIGSGTSSPVETVIPQTIPAGTAYRIRVVSSYPALIGSDNGEDISIEAFPEAPEVAASSRCESGTFHLTVPEAKPGHSYRWYSQENEGFLLSEGAASTFKTSFLEHSTTFWVSEVSRAGCESGRSPVEAIVPWLSVEASLIPSFCITTTVGHGFTGQEIAFANSSSGADTYLWEFGDGASSPETNPTHQYNEPGRYSVQLTAYGANGCQEVKKVADISIVEKKPIPNVITPNGDGKNQAFVLQFTCLPVQLQVFNRMGKLVYEESPYKNTWEGGSLATGVYYYQLKADSGEKWKGWIQIIR